MGEVRWYAMTNTVKKLQKRHKIQAETTQMLKGMCTMQKYNSNIYNYGTNVHNVIIKDNS